MVKVSVILPVYGVAQYIVKCTESLLAQTLDDMEFIYVDDHGPDNSIELVKQTIAGHPREGQFRFLKPEHNMGAGMARNFAIPQSEGEYIAFVDSDDWVEPNMFEELYNEAKRQGGADLCYCQASKDYLNDKPSEILRSPEVEPGEFAHAKRVHFLANYVSYFWTFIYRREQIENNAIRYPEERSADDSYFVACNLLTAKTIARVDKPFYHYLIRPGSVVTTKNTTKYQKRLAVFGHLMDYAKKCGVYEEFKSEVDYIYIKKGCLSSVLNYIYNTSEPQREVLAEIMAELDRQVPDFATNTYYRNHIAPKAMMQLVRKCPRTALWLLPKYVKMTKPTV
ncbi:MAG: glycosyltransferase [Bacteroidales bacterium]|nr:glycosyltransferase [Bacteroidales bacterium]